jgi:chromosome segregation ATPase
VKGKCNNLTNRNQDHTSSPEPSTPTSPNPGHLNTPEKLDLDLKAYLMMMVEDNKKDFNNSLKEIQENTTKQVEDLKEEAQQSLKELQENTMKEVMELNKDIQDLKREVDTIKKTQSEATLEIQTLGKKSETIDASIRNRIEEMEEEISGGEDSIENISTTIKENGKYKKILTQNIQEIQDTMRKPNLRIIGVDEKRFSNQKASKYLQQNYRRKLPKPKERDAHEHTRILQNSK